MPTTIQNFETWLTASGFAGISADDRTAITDIFNSSDISRANLRQIFVFNPSLCNIIARFLKQDAQDGQGIKHEGGA